MRTHAFANLVRHPRGEDGVLCARQELGPQRGAYADTRIVRFVVGLVFFGFLVASDVTASRGASVAYVYQSVGNSFGTMNVQTGAFTSIGPGGAVYEDMTSLPGGPLYTLDSSDRLLTVDPNTGGIASVIGTIGSSLEGLKFNASGTLFGFNSNDLYTVNTANGQATLVGAFSGIAAPRFNFEAAFNGNTMYVSVGNGPGGNSNLYTVDTNTGVASLIGGIGYTPRALDFQDGTLYGFALGNPAGSIITIDTTTGAGTILVRNPQGTQVDSATPLVSAVPEPGSVCLLGIGIAGAVVSLWWARTRSGAAGKTGGSQRPKPTSWYGSPGW